MTFDKTPTVLEKLIPKSLDDVIRSNRDMCRLTLATEQELLALEMQIQAANHRHTVTNWQVIVLHITQKDGSQEASPRLIGQVEGSGKSWFTSHVVGIDTSKGLVQTENSIYRVIGPRGKEENIDLLNICAFLHQCGVGRYLGVTEIYY